MLLRAFMLAFVVSTLVGFQGQEARAARPKSQSLLPMLQVLDNASLSGSLEVSGRCDLQDFPDFPRFRDPVSNGGPFQNLHEMLADDLAMQVTQDPVGIIRMIESGVPTDLLNIRIGHISFEDNVHNDIYTANDAMRFILWAPEVVAFMKARDIEWPNIPDIFPGVLTPSWPPESPHISGSLDNVTVSEALDYVLRTFPGIWFYENCPQSNKKGRAVYFRFYHLRKIGTSAFVESEIPITTLENPGTDGTFPNLPEPRQSKQSCGQEVNPPAATA